MRSMKNEVAEGIISMLSIWHDGNSNPVPSAEADSGEILGTCTPGFARG